MTSGRIGLSKKDDLAVITLNRPEARNALSPDMVADLARALQSCRSPDIRAVLITGAGGAFCAGADVKEMMGQLEQGGPEGLSHHLRDLAETLHHDVILPIRHLEKPVVAGINGVAAGAGFSLTLACDIRLASSNSRFFMAYANIGCTPDGGSTYLLPRLVGQGKAMEIFLASQPLSAERAMEMGLITQAVPAADFDRHALETATRLARGPTLVYGRIKALFDRCWDADLENQLNAETEDISNIGLTRDFQEGIRAFAQKHQAQFRGK